MWTSRTGSLTVLFFCLMAMQLLSGCVTMRDPEASFDYTGDVVAKLTSDGTVAQTIRSRRPGLNGIQLWLRKENSQAADSGVLTVDVYDTFQHGEPLASVPVSYARLGRSFPVNVPFPAQTSQEQQAYAITLKTQGAPLLVYGRSEDAYPDGSLYIDGVASAADLGFRTSYAYGRAAIISDLARLAQNSWLLIPLLTLLFLPGMLVLEAANFISVKNGPPSSQETGGNQLSGEKSFLQDWDWGECCALAVGLSMSITPVLLLWTTTLGLQVSRWSALAYAGFVSAAWLGLTVWRRRRGLRLPGPDWIDLALSLVFVLALATRLIMVRDLAAPAWVDPVHHAAITRLIIEHGAYPQSYAPYVQASTASYHPGFHALVAFLHWVSGLEIHRTMLLLGQVMNGLCVLAVYLLGTSLTHRRLAGLAAGLICGFLTPMPAYYTSWGRYTQLAGLLILPVCAALLVRLFDRMVFLPKVGRPASSSPKTTAQEPQGAVANQGGASNPRGGIILMLLAALSGAGLFLVHYRVAAFLALLMAAFFLGELLRSLNKLPVWQTVPRALLWLSAAVFVAVMLSLPWWPDLWHSLLQPRLANTAPRPEILKLDWGYLTPGLGELALWLALAGLLISLLQARWFGPVLALWVGLLFLSANQGAVRIPGPGNINLTSVEIVLFMPISVLGGYAIAFGLELIARLQPAELRRAVYLLVGAALAVIAWAGAQRLIPILNADTLIFREADRPAIEWIEANLPQSATILINPFLWGYGNYAGYDGGYWISPLAGRKTFPPNLLYAMGEQASIHNINQTAREVIDLADNPTELNRLLKQEGISYIYLGRRSGVLSPQRLLSGPGFTALYQKDGTWVFEVK